MKRPFAIALFVHILLISLIWVGFPVPMPRNNSQFSYEGYLMPTEDVLKRSAQVNPEAKAVKVQTTEGALFAPWVRMRDLNKPR